MRTVPKVIAVVPSTTHEEKKGDGSIYSFSAFPFISRKHIELEPKKVVQSKIWNKDKYVARRTDCVYGTSYWITQESGYAIAHPGTF